MSQFNLTWIWIDMTFSNMGSNLVNIVLAWINMIWSKLSPTSTWHGSSLTRSDVNLTQLGSMWDSLDSIKDEFDSLNQRWTRFNSIWSGPNWINLMWAQHWLHSIRPNPTLVSLTWTKFDSIQCGTQLGPSQA